MGILALSLLSIGLFIWLWTRKTSKRVRTFVDKKSDSFMDKVELESEIDEQEVFAELEEQIDAIDQFRSVSTLRARLEARKDEAK